MLKKILTSISFIAFSCTLSNAQVTGGQRAMEFLRLPNSPHISALGGFSVSNPDQDISFAMQNPSMMRPGLHNMLGLNYNFYYSGIKSSNLQYGYHVPEVNTSFAFGVQYLSYGDFVQTDVLGNQLGNFKANDYALTFAGSRRYKEKWRYGAALKWAHSGYADRKASAMLMDVGVTYMDTASLWTIAAVAKNMGFMVKKFNPAYPAEPLPFDLQIGISKRLKYVPLRLMATLHHLYQWDIRYDDPNEIDNQNIFGGDSTTKEKSYFADKLFRHFTFGAELLIGKRLLVSASYNHQRRAELVLKEKTGLAGFAFGLGVNLNKFQVHYAYSQYHIAGGYNELGINIALNKIMGIGKTGDKIHWNATYPDWEMETIPVTPEPADALEN
ncbi:MAG: type IX secretion system protein PorQ [Chitinophagales bacterium]|nr:type IX secretion system protein PorQ [Chitinophagaceae bacterium]MCB9065523.1 type IX secretion system protein PorQ [Chitinophagales bacterium]